MKDRKIIAKLVEGKEDVVCSIYSCFQPSKDYEYSGEEEINRKYMVYHVHTLEPNSIKEITDKCTNKPNWKNVIISIRELKELLEYNKDRGRNILSRDSLIENNKYIGYNKYYIFYNIDWLIVIWIFKVVNKNVVGGNIKERYILSKMNIEFTVFLYDLKGVDVRELGRFKDDKISDRYHKENLIKFKKEDVNKPKIENIDDYFFYINLKRIDEKVIGENKEEYNQYWKDFYNNYKLLRDLISEYINKIKEKLGNRKINEKQKKILINILKIELEIREDKELRYKNDEEGLRDKVNKYYKYVKDSRYLIGLGKKKRKKIKG